MIPLAIPSLDGNEAAYLQECIDSTFVSSVGPFVSRFEAMLADATGAVGAVSTSAGTTGLHLALMTVGVRPGDLVVVPSLTFIASANAVSHCGATPWLMDVGADSWTLSPQVLEAAFAAEAEMRGKDLVHRASGRRISAILPVYTLGMPAQMDAIVAIARRHGLPVVADAAAALGATVNGRPIGQSGADLSVISFNGNKTVTTGGGGAIIGNDPALLQRARHVSGTARVGSDYHHDQVGYNYRMTNLQAAVGCAQMERLDQLVAAKRAIAAHYRDTLACLPGVHAFPAPEWTQGACWLSGVLVDAPPAVVAGLRAELVRRGVDARPFWKPLHLQPPYVTAPRTAMPVCEGVWEKIVTLPSSASLSAADRDAVVAAFRGAHAALGEAVVRS